MQAGLATQRMVVMLPKRNLGHLLNCAFNPLGHQMAMI